MISKQFLRMENTRSVEPTLAISSVAIPHRWAQGEEHPAAVISRGNRAPCNRIRAGSKKPQ